MTIDLLSKVLGITVTKIRDDIVSKNTIYYETTDKEINREFSPSIPHISYCELAFKCKDWALTQKYILSSKPRTNSSFASCSFDKNGKSDYYDDFHNDFRAETEVEAIIKACEWVLENSKETND